jgi:hypothetical protein
MFRQRTFPALLLAAGVVAALVACAPVPSDPPVDQGGGVAQGGDTPGGEPGLTVPGTGTFAIGTEVPFGGYQLQGEPDSQPDGCSWQILDEDGKVSFENQGVYVFLTDVPEAVTFVTDGCPDWEQFE